MLRPLLRFWRKSYDDNLTGMAAMVAYNLMLSVFPLALVALIVAGPILASDEIEASVVKDLQRLFPEAASSTLVGHIPWRCVWPGALGALVAMGIVDYGFPLYLSNVTSLRIGTSFLFVLIVLVWFYVLALILLAGAVVNELRFEGRQA
ncbi:MAG: YihY/virulence factor BrkB family protein [Solirubrobacterales bacterium]|nr:YihY/virulence factor BrkB family protein [Solirubrobacterales bacterium]